jgi:hypothetical protein
MHFVIWFFMLSFLLSDGNKVLQLYGRPSNYAG